MMSFISSVNLFPFLLDSQETADQAAFRVTVTYTNIQTPIIDLDDAIKKKSFFTLPSWMQKAVVGNADRQYYIIYIIH